MGVIHISDEKFIINVRVQPKCAKIGWGEVLDGTSIQLKINAPPVDGAANKACVKFIAKEFKAPKSSVTIIKGAKNRNKAFQVVNWDPSKLRSFLETYGLIQ